MTGLFTVSKCICKISPMRRSLILPLPRNQGSHTKGAAPPFIKDCIQDHLEFDRTMWDQNFSQNGTALLFHEALSLIWCCTSTILPTL